MRLPHFPCLTQKWPVFKLWCCKGVARISHIEPPHRVRFSAEYGDYLLAPPGDIPAEAAGVFCIGSSATLGGAGGSVLYELEGHGGVCRLDYAAPVLASNSYDHRCPKGFAVERSGGAGYAAEVTFVLRQANEGDATAANASPTNTSS